MIDKDQVMQLVQMKGYVLPADLTRQFHADTFIMGAVLSDLVREKKLNISRVKIGRSPVYYTTQHRAKLQDLYKYLDEKDKRTYDLLKEKVVLQGSMQTSLLRVSLKNMKDFAKPIEVTVAGKTELFYKWYLASDQEVHRALTALLTVVPVKEEKRVIVEAPVVAPIVEKPVEKIVKKIEPVVQKIEKPIEKKIVEPKIDEKKVETIKKSEVVVQHDQQQHLGTDLISRLMQHDDPFAQQIAIFFQKHTIQVVHFAHVKKGELDCVVKVPSAVGDITYFCKAKKKKKCSEGDLATAFVAAQMKKLPALFLTPGSFPKKVVQKLPTDYPNTKILEV
jgi:hypothetical protein